MEMRECSDNLIFEFPVGWATGAHFISLYLLILTLNHLSLKSLDDPNFFNDK